VPRKPKATGIESLLMIFGTKILLLLNKIWQEINICHIDNNLFFKSPLLGLDYGKIT